MKDLITKFIPGGSSSSNNNAGNRTPEVRIEVTEPENIEDDDEEEEERVQWKSPMQFFMTILGFCVGLGNIWRFPYLCQQNGGGAFVIPFLIMMVLEGMPLLLLELGIGQKMRTGSLGVWNRVHPWLGGIGLGSTVIAIVVGCYYNMIIAWCLFYLFKSIKTLFSSGGLEAELPWAHCPTTIVGNNITEIVPECAQSSETSYFWYREALDISDSIDNFDGIRWWMILALAIAWIVVYLIIMKGIQSSGYVVYFTACFPYLVMTIFFIRGLTLPGSGSGLLHMFYPKMDKLLDPNIWLAAANQVFYSYGLAFGSIISFGSYNAPDTNCVRDVFLLTACNAFTAVYACAVIFAILGFKAQHLFEKCLHRDVGIILDMTELWSDKSIENVTVEEYSGLMESHVLISDDVKSHLSNCSLEEYLNDAAQGTGLAFIVMADAFTKLPGSPFWSFLFFSMLLSLGLGSQIGILEGMISTLFDMPQLKNVNKPLLTGTSCIICFLIGVLFTTGAGEYWLTLFDAYGAMGLTLIALVEIVAVMYVYGHEKFTNDIKMMTGVKPGLYWQMTWRFIAPILLTLILAASLINQFRNPPTYSAWNKDKAKSEQKDFPEWSLMIGAFLALASIFPIVVIGLSRFFGCSTAHADYEPGSPMKRVETTASTHPMMHGFNNEDDVKSESSDSESGIVVAKDGLLPTSAEEKLIDMSS